MEEDLLKQYRPLIPHKYPLWVKLFSLLLLFSFLYSLYLLPEYFGPSKKFKQGTIAYQNHSYVEAIRLFGYVLETVPSSKKAKIAIAKAYFANGDPNDDEKGLVFLQGISLDKDSWGDLVKVMPVEYYQYFKDR